MADRKRSIYLLPNILTTIALFSGFFAIVAGINQHINVAVIAFYIAMIMDTLDGRIARLTDTQSDFGAQYDSLSDMVAFGVAPPLLAYSWGLHALGRIGWITAFTYLACVGLRLARFNCQRNKTDPTYFIGLPCPAGAAMVIGCIWMLNNTTLPSSPTSLWLLTATMIAVAALMVSNILFYSFKQFDFTGHVGFLTLLSVVLLLIVIMLDPFKLLFLVFTFYTLSGPLLSVWRYLRKKRVQRHDKSG